MAPDLTGKANPNKNNAGTCMRPAHQQDFAKSNGFATSMVAADSGGILGHIDFV